MWVIRGGGANWVGDQGTGAGKKGDLIIKRGKKSLSREVCMGALGQSRKRNQAGPRCNISNCRFGSGPSRRKSGWTSYKRKKGKSGSKEEGGKPPFEATSVGP